MAVNQTSAAAPVEQSTKRKWVWALPAVAVLLAGGGVLAYSRGVFGPPQGMALGGRGGGGPSLASCDVNAHQDPSDPTVAIKAQDILDDKTMVFPPDFIWGTATSSYQIEGAVDVDGRGPSIWDKFSHTPHKVERNENGDIACDHYHRYKSDVALMAALGIKNYRFSVSWPRVIPTGDGPVNAKGLKFYSDLVDELIKHKIEPFVTMYHWDLPLALQEKHDGWLRNETVVPAFAKYADTLFEALGDRVKHWITFNEPWCTAVLGHGIGVHAPGKKLPQSGVYRAAHNQLLSHAAAVKVYRTKYAAEQKGKIGITLNSDFKQAACNSTADLQAAERSQIWALAWFADPVFFGDYPKEMKETAGHRLPSFTEEQKKDLKGSADFFGLNHYTTAITTAGTFRTKGSYYADIQAKDGNDPSWTHGESGWLFNVPWGFRKLLNWVKTRYNDPDILVTENGASEPKEGKLTDEEALNDPWRQRFIGGYMSEMYKALHFDKVKVKGYFCWSFYDNFEWADGYRPRFGIVRVNFTTQERMPKKSALQYAKWINKFSGNQGLPQDAETLLPPLEKLAVKAFKIPAAPVTSDPTILPHNNTAIKTMQEAKQASQFGPVEGQQAAASKPAAGEEARKNSTIVSPKGDAGASLQEVGSGFFVHMNGEATAERADKEGTQFGPVEGGRAGGQEMGPEGKVRDAMGGQDAGDALEGVGTGFLGHVDKGVPQGEDGGH